MAPTVQCDGVKETLGFLRSIGTGSKTDFSTFRVLSFLEVNCTYERWKMQRQVGFVECAQRIVISTAESAWRSVHAISTVRLAANVMRSEYIAAENRSFEGYVLAKGDGPGTVCNKIGRISWDNIIASVVLKRKTRLNSDRLGFDADELNHVALRTICTNLQQGHHWNLGIYI